MRSSKCFESRLEQLRQQLAAWRRESKQHQRTPDPVWQEAVELARALGISRVARALRLNYTGLKRRLTLGVARSEGVPTFVEVKCTSPVPAVSASECRVCLHDPAGGQMSVVMAATDAAVLRELAQVFWRRAV